LGFVVSLADGELDSVFTDGLGSEEGSDE
jgi:hypothetical protein